MGFALGSTDSLNFDLGVLHDLPPTRNFLAQSARRTAENLEEFLRRLE